MKECGVSLLLWAQRMQSFCCHKQ